MASLPAMLLQACAPVAVAKSDSKVESVQQQTEALRRGHAETLSSASVIRTARPRLAGEEILVRPVDALPEVLARKITYSTSGAQRLGEVLQAVSQQIGLTIRAGEITASSPSGQPAPSAPGQPTAAPTGALAGGVQIDFVNRPVTALLDEIAAQNDVSWRYVAKTRSVEFFRFESRTLSVYLPPGAKSVAASISLASVSGGGGGSGSGGGGSGAGGSGGGDVSVSQSMTIDPWSSIMGGIAGMLGEGEPSRGGPAGAQASGGRPGGAAAGMLSVSGRAGRATANPELGIISVTARPAEMERIASYVASINSRFAQNVVVDVKIYQVTLDQQASYGFSLDALYQRLTHYGISVVGSAPLQAGQLPGQLTLSFDRGRWAGSSVLVQALAQFGQVALQTQGQVIAINGQPSPIQVANELNYLAASQTTTAPNVGSTTSLQPGTRVIGFTANFLPLILGDNRILLQYQMQISQLTALTQVVAGGSSIQTPQISSQSLQQQAFVRDGQSIVLFGFDQNRDTTDSAGGIGGASRTGASQRQMMVIVLQVNGGRKHDA